MSKTPDLEERFLQPKNWQWGEFTNQNRTLRFGHVSPAQPDGIIVCLPGLSEFCEKYFETARDCLAMNYAFWVIDWAGQGLSTRSLKNPHKRHSDGFQNDIDDLSAFINQCVSRESGNLKNRHKKIPASAGNTDHDLPLIMLGHSMGSNIGMHYLSQNPNVFSCAAFSAPMFGIKVFAHIPPVLSAAATWVFHILAAKAYVPGGGDWRERPAPDNDMFSSDPKRGAVQDAWCLANPPLQNGHVTNGWLYHAHRSCLKLQRETEIKDIKTPCLLAKAGLERLVDNQKIDFMAKNLPNSALLTLESAYHEILMEKDENRQKFFDTFKEFVRKNAET